MPFTSKSLKDAAKQAMAAAVPSAVLMTLVYMLLTDVLSTLVNLILPPLTAEQLIYDRGMSVWVALFITVLLAIYRMVMGFGYSAWSLRTARQQQSGFWNLLDGFGMVGTVLLMELLVFLRIFLWTMLLAMAYAFAAVLSALIHPILTAGLTVLFYLSVLTFSLRFELAHFLLYDYPEAGAGAAVRRSMEMMRGNVWNLIKLYLSFWPWYLAMFLLGCAALALSLIPALGSVAIFAAGGDFTSLFNQFMLALDSTLSTVASLLATLVIGVRFIPYQHIAVANFYRALSAEPVAPSFSGESF